MRRSQVQALAGALSSNAYQLFFFLRFLLIFGAVILVVVVVVVMMSHLWTSVALCSHRYKQMSSYKSETLGLD
jgi:hypothetical protein